MVLVSSRGEGCIRGMTSRSVLLITVSVGLYPYIIPFLVLMDTPHCPYMGVYS